MVVRAGWYGREGQRRQRWKCTTVEGDTHRFAEVLPRIVNGSAEHECQDGATSLEPREGGPLRGCTGSPRVRLPLSW